MTIISFLQSARGIFVHVFVRYGAGADHLLPFTKTKWWNILSWCLIAVGLVGWAVFIFLID